MTTTHTENRFLLITKKIFIEQKRMLLIAIAAYFGVCVLLGSWFGLMGAPLTDMGSGLYIMVGLLSCTITASMMFTDMGNKLGRINLLMTPARPSDIFWNRFLFAFPFTLLVLVAGFFLFSYSNILFFGFATDNWISLSLPNFGDWDKKSWEVFAFAASCFLLNEALFMFGAIAWPKKSFLKTLGLMTALNIVWSLIAGLIMRNMILRGLDFNINIEALIISTSCGFFLCAAALVWWAYYKFKNATLISRF